MSRVPQPAHAQPPTTDVPPRRYMCHNCGACTDPSSSPRAHPRWTSGLTLGPVLTRGLESGRCHVPAVIGTLGPVTALTILHARLLVPSPAPETPEPSLCPS